MAARVLQQKEEKIFQMFSKVRPEVVETTQVSLGTSSEMYTVANPLIYRIPNTNYHLIFGDIRKSMSISQMKKWLEEHMKANPPSKNEENVIDGEDNEEAALCAHGCTHDEAAKDEPVNEDDVKLIVDQCKVTREEAIQALKSTGNDVVSALVELGKKK